MVTRDVRGGSGDAPVDLGPPRPGDLFEGRYQIESLIGEGGFGMVFAAKDTALDRDIALKVLGKAASDPTVLARFLLEAKAAASLESEHVATVYEVGLAARRPYIVMERLRGRDLHDELHERVRIATAEATELVLQAALGLAHAHARGIVHRDLKPRNLFLARRADGTRLVKILDFGIAKTGSLELTETGASFGTTRYMAPEQLRSSRSVDARSDIWALGVVLYELTTGSPIFDAPHSAEFGVQILSDPHVSPRTRLPELTAELERVIDRCLEKDADRRYRDLVAFAHALGPLTTDAGRALIPRIEHTLESTADTAIAVRTSAGTATSHARGQLGPRAPERGNRLLIAGALLIGIGGIAFGTVMYMRSDRVPDAGSTAVQVAASSAPAVVTADASVTAVTPVDAAPVAIASVPADSAAVAPPSDAGTKSVVPRAASTKTTPEQTTMIEEACIAMDKVNLRAKGENELVRNGHRAGGSIVELPPRPPLFLVPGEWCDELAALGCAKIIKGCTAAISDDEKRSCRDFLPRVRPKVCK